MGKYWSPYVTLEPENIETVGTDRRRASGGVAEAELDCLIEVRPEDSATGIQFRDCLIDYTRCPNHNCVKKLV